MMFIVSMASSMYKSAVPFFTNVVSSLLGWQRILDWVKFQSVWP